MENHDPRHHAGWTCSPRRTPPTAPSRKQEGSGSATSFAGEGRNHCSHRPKRQSQARRIHHFRATRHGRHEPARIPLGLGNPALTPRPFERPDSLPRKVGTEHCSPEENCCPDGESALYGFLSAGFRIAPPTGAYHTWKGSLAEGTTIEPDQTIEVERRNRRAANDLQLDRAVESPLRLSAAESG